MKKILASIALLIILAPTTAAQAAGKLDLWGNQKGNIEGELGMNGDKDPRVLAAQVITILLGFLGIVAVILIITAGFKWMTAGGDKAQIDEAKNLMKNAVIGLIIIMSAWALSNFIINSAMQVTGNQ
jgi:hypothetical protein